MLSVVSGDNVTASTVDGATKKLTDKMNADISEGDDDKTKLLRANVIGYGESYMARMKDIFAMTGLNQKKKEEITTNLTLAYLSRVEASKGFQLE